MLKIFNQVVEKLTRKSLKGRDKNKEMPHKEISWDHGQFMKAWNSSKLNKQISMKNRRS